MLQTAVRRHPVPRVVSGSAGKPRQFSPGISGMRRIGLSAGKLRHRQAAAAGLDPLPPSSATGIQTCTWPLTPKLECDASRWCHLCSCASMCLIQDSFQNSMGPGLLCMSLTATNPAGPCRPTSCVRLIKLPDGISGECLCRRQLAAVGQRLCLLEGHPLRLPTPGLYLWAGRAHLVWDDCLEPRTSVQLLAGLEGQKRMS